jgi:uncharacterized membrane protein
MSLPDTEPVPDDPEQLSPARRRRARRLVVPMDAGERSIFLDDLAHRLSPNFDFYLFSFAAGLVMGIGFLLDAPSLLVLGTLVAPLMAPALGLSFGTVIGSVRFFGRSLFGMLLGGALAFWGGAMAGAITTVWQPAPFNQVSLFVQLSWTNFIVLAVGIVLTALSFMHSERPSPVPSVAVAYELYLPLAAAGFGLSSHIPNLWPDGLLIFAVYLAWAALLGAFTLALLGLRPASLFGYMLSGVVLLLGILLIIGISSSGAVIGSQTGSPTLTPTPTPTLAATSTPTALSASATLMPEGATATLQPPSTPTPGITHTPTITSTPLPIFAYIDANTGGGALVRAEPGGDIIRSYLNGTLVEVLPESAEANGYTWVKIRIVQDGTEGWILRSLLLVATPSPNW